MPTPRKPTVYYHKPRSRARRWIAWLLMWAVILFLLMGVGALIGIMMAAA